MRYSLSFRNVLEELWIVVVKGYIQSSILNTFPFVANIWANLKQYSYRVLRNYITKKGPNNLATSRRYCSIKKMATPS
jgi:hypothetical protein